MEFTVVIDDLSGEAPHRWISQPPRNMLRDDQTTARDVAVQFGATLAPDQRLRVWRGADADVDGWDPDAVAYGLCPAEPVWVPGTPPGEFPAVCGKAWPCPDHPVV